MDNSRLKDLERIQSTVDNPRKSAFVRRNAHVAKRSILTQMKDRKLGRLRHRLIGAARANDHNEQVKIRNIIKAYKKQDRMED